MTRSGISSLPSIDLQAVTEWNISSARCNTLGDLAELIMLSCQDSTPSTLNPKPYTSHTRISGANPAIQTHNFAADLPHPSRSPEPSPLHFVTFFLVPGCVDRFGPADGAAPIVLVLRAQ